ncbi:MAG: M48 family metalloprotease [Minwuia sp.]|nr:M48 family metalloprotease [Minwuia sp.]
MRKLTWKSLFVWLPLAVMTLTAACTSVTNPATGESELSAVSPAEERAIGQQEHPKVLAEFGGEYSDPVLREYVNTIGQNLAKNAELPADTFTFTLLDTPVVNAFALPGGYVYVTRGLLTILNDESELAGVMGHEIGHVTARHGARRQTQGMIANILAAGVGILSGNRQVAQLGQAAAQGFLASYSRDNEREADQLGVRYLSRTGYQTLGMARSLEAIGRHSAMLSQVSGQEAQEFNFFQTHPQTPERVANTVSLARQSFTAQNAVVGRDSYLNTVSGMIYGDTPEQGFARGTRFVHPNMRFAFDVPDGFRLDNLPNAVLASGPDGTRISFDRESDRKVVAQYSNMANYISRQWAKGARGRDLRSVTIGGFPAATAIVFMTAQNGQRFEARIAAIRFSDTQIFRFMMAAPAEVADRYARSFDDAINSFRGLSQSEAAGYKPLRIYAYTVRRGDTISGLAARMNIDRFDEMRFRTVNALDEDAVLQVGQKVKIISE